MSEQAQLNYIKLVLIAAETYNKIPKSLVKLRQMLRTTQQKSTIIKTIKEIKTNFPKFQEDGDFYYFEEFEEKTNYIRANPRNAQVSPKVVVDKEKEKEKDKEKRKKRFIPPSLDEVKSYVQEKAYKIDAENFINFYTAKGWMVGKNKMKDWKAAIRTWANRDKGGKNGKPTRGSLDIDKYQRELDAM